MALENGKLPKSDLKRIHHPNYKVYLRKDAAASFNTLRLWSKKWLKKDLYPTGAMSAYRSLQQQSALWTIYQSGGNLAAVPGTSNHGWGKAIDLPTWTMQQVIKKFGQNVGWNKIEAFSEPWHYNYVGNYKRPNPGLSVKYPRAKKGSGGWGQKWFVKKLERRLKKLGYKNVTVDGQFGKVTDRAVKDFQRNKGLKADGIVNKKTWQALYNAKPRGYRKQFQ